MNKEYKNENKENKIKLLKYDNVIKTNNQNLW